MVPLPVPTSPDDASSGPVPAAPETEPAAAGSPRLALRGTVVTEGLQLMDAVVVIDGDRLDYVGPWDVFARDAGPSTYAVEDLPGNALLLPGLVDLHCHGGYGVDFTSSSQEEIEAALPRLYATGTTTLLASIMSAPAERMVAACERLGALAATGTIAGVHAEGPFLAPTRCGAQPAEHLLAYDADLVDALAEAAAGQLRTMTYAPELEDSDALVEQLVTHGVVPSLGHTDADVATAAESLALAAEELDSAGFDGYAEVPTVTHCFNGMAPWHHRAPGAAGAALDAAAEEDAVLEVIGDGHHLAPQTVRMLFNLLPESALMLVSDATSAVGLSDGTHRLGDQEITVSGGVGRTADGRLAGGTSTLLDGLRSVVAAGIPVQRAVPAATSIPASLIGLADEVGQLHAGFSADVLVATEQLEPLAVYRHGRRVLS
ncbi:amidohydrolase family protein [Zhihengliuella sp.]|uniref:N-acetylglucosamine-6-phosphate deacetylase n=1 Tax=Zhihengliuella sp. TaxID=1954483 RepID=UPI0028117A49|nr:amidohydrolase family protein [Zhihengliuella sp.]